MNNIEFVNKLVDIARNYKTLYVYGCFGAPMTKANRERYANHTSYNKQPSRTKMIMAATPSTFGFDCVCLIKGVLWGWTGDKNKVYGGASYAVNGVPDIGADAMIKKCKDVSTDFSNLEVGEAVWMSGHIGVYIGNGLAVECTPKWDNCVQITACNCEKTGYNRRNWTKHGKLPYIEYAAETKPAVVKKSVTEVAQEVIDGKWGNGDAREIALTKAGYDYDEVQNKVNELVRTPNTPVLTDKKSVDDLAREVLAGKWYTGAARKSALTKAGYDYDAVQTRVNELLNVAKKSITAVAKEVVAGKWGNGTARDNALKKAGYTAAEITAIQNKVNELI